MITYANNYRVHICVHNYFFNRAFPQLVHCNIEALLSLFISLHCRSIILVLISIIILTIQINVNFTIPTTKYSKKNIANQYIHTHTYTPKQECQNFFLMSPINLTYLIRILIRLVSNKQFNNINSGFPIVKHVSS